MISHKHGLGSTFGGTVCLSMLFLDEAENPEQLLTPFFCQAKTARRLP
jgi:hypothetical protein